MKKDLPIPKGPDGQSLEIQENESPPSPEPFQPREKRARPIFRPRRYLRPLISAAPGGSCQFAGHAIQAAPPMARQITQTWSKNP